MLFAATSCCAVITSTRGFSAASAARPTAEASRVGCTRGSGGVARGGWGTRRPSGPRSGLPVRPPARSTGARSRSARGRPGTAAGGSPAPASRRGCTPGPARPRRRKPRSTRATRSRGPTRSRRTTPVPCIVVPSMRNANVGSESCDTRTGLHDQPGREFERRGRPAYCAGRASPVRATRTTCGEREMVEVLAVGVQRDLAAPQVREREVLPVVAVRVREDHGVDLRPTTRRPPRSRRGEHRGCSPQSISRPNPSVSSSAAFPLLPLASTVNRAVIAWYSSSACRHAWYTCECCGNQL